MLLARSRELMVEERRERTKAEWKKRSWAGSAGWLQRNVHLSEWERNSLWGEPFLKRNKTERSEAYKDLNDYLDVQFRLFREDFVFSLGDGIRSLTKKILQRKNGLKTYTLRECWDHEHGLYESRNWHSIHLDMRNLRRIPWEHSKRLLFGSFLCFSKDNIINHACCLPR